MRFSARGTALYLTLIVAVFAGGLAGGYVYKHEPQPAVLSLQITPPPAPAERFAGGSVIAVGAGAITIASGEGQQEFPLAADFVVESLEAAPEVQDGATANVGLERTAYGLYLTGVVELAEAP